MSSLTILKGVQQSFAHWFPNEQGSYVYKVSAGEKELTFSSPTQLSSKQVAFLEFAEKSASDWLAQPKRFRSHNFMTMFHEELLVFWLQQYSPKINRERWLHALEHLRHRSYENRKLRLNLIVTRGTGTLDFLDQDLQKIFDPLAGDPSVYFRVDQDFHFIAYEEIDSYPLPISDRGTLAPECVQAFLPILESEDLFLHFNTHGEILLACRDGLLARFRLGNWLLFEPQQLYFLFWSLFIDEQLGKNVLDLLFELSYRRRGALLIFDPEHKTLAHISNGDILSHENNGKEESPAHRLLMPTISKINLKSPLARERRKYLLLELAEIDGAIVFDFEKILAFGAMIEPYGVRSRCFGSRTLAALSSANRHAVACKVGSEGDIIIYFQDPSDAATVIELKIY